MAITLSESAADRIRHFLSKEGGVGMRVGVKKTGCSGFAYVVELADVVRSGDEVFEDRGVTVVVDAGSLPYLDGTTIDFARESLNEGFRYDNPNVKSLCGCGESFGI
jgi:iron-sulfur cluster assembly protein